MNYVDGFEKRQHKDMHVKEFDLMNQEKEFYKIIDAVPASVYWKDINGVYLGCNKYMLEMAGLSHVSEIIGKKDSELPWKNIADDLFQIDQDVFKNKKRFEIEESPMLANQQQKIFLTTKTPLIGTNGEAYGLIGVSVDITERKKNEIALKEEKEKAEAASRAKTEFLENMRHDLRTPLTGIVGFANIISNEIKDSAVKEYVDNLIASSHALLELINEILEVIKINAGEVPITKTKFNLQKRLQDVIDINKAKAKEKNIDLFLVYDEAIPRYVIGDSMRIHRIALELVTNALIFTHRGEVSIHVELAKMQEREMVIKMSVQDTGVGIAFEKQQEIFQYFKKLHPSYQGLHRGAGLGLAIVKHFIDEMDGEIYVESALGLGTKFTCILSLKKSLLDEPFGVTDLTSKETWHPAHDQTNREGIALDKQVTRHSILLVEDHAIAAMVVKTMLSNMNCHVDIAVSGVEAITLIEEKNYDLIFMDIGLPDIDGYEVVKKIRQNESKKSLHVPIIALTAHVDEENKQRCIEAGMNAVLSKPLVNEKAEDILNAFIPYRKIFLKKEEKSDLSFSIHPDALPEIYGSVLDFKAAQFFLGGETQDVDEMLDAFAQTIPEELKQLELSYLQLDWEKIKSIAHKLKGAACYLGTHRLKEACSQLEECVNKQYDGLLTKVYDQLILELKKIEAAIQGKNN